MIDIERLYTDWLNRTPIAGKEVSRRCFDQVIAAYYEPHRHYHTLTHINSMLTQLNALNAPDAAFWATWYHDVVYDPTRPDNEEKSAELAMQHLNVMGIDHGEIVQMILATKMHKVDHSRPEHIQQFLDADMGILGASPEVYERYTKNVRAEFAMYPDELYRMGRLAFIKATLEQPEIYGTVWFKERLEAQAVSNLKHEQQILSE